MKFIKNQFLKIVSAFLASCGITCSFVACYGMPPRDWDDSGFPVPQTVKVVGDIDGDGTKEGVSGIAIDIKDKNLGRRYFTDKYGYADIKFLSNRDILVSDVDGEENGSFESAIVSPPDIFDDSYNQNELLIIKLERKNKE